MMSENPDPQQNPHNLSKDDQRHIDDLEKKFRLIRDYTWRVATGHSSGLFVHGSGGCGKNHIVSECMGMNRTLDIRMFVNSLSDYAMWRECQSSCHWRDLVSARIKERPTHITEAKSIEDRRMQKVDELKLVNELAMVSDPQKRFQIWYDKTGKSQASLYRRLKELKDEK